MEALHCGKVSNAELISWFNTTENQMRTKKKKFLETLKEYCDFTPIYGGVEITEVRNPYYIKNINDEIVRKEFLRIWDESGLDSCKRVADELYSRNSSLLTNTPSSIYNKVRALRLEWYGTPFGEGGSRGVCRYVWCKRLDTGRLEALTPQEEKIKKDLMREYFGTEEENGKIFEADFGKFLLAFRLETGVGLVKGTKLEDWGSRER